MVLEVLRQPLEDREVHISRVNAAFTYPADFILIAAMNPCPCGYLGDPQRECTCLDGEIRRYGQKISGPLLDRIDLHVSVMRPKYSELTATIQGRPSCDIAKRVAEARAVQAERLSRWHMQSNAQMGHRQLKETCQLDAEGTEMHCVSSSKAAPFGQKPEAASLSRTDDPLTSRVPTRSAPSMSRKQSVSEI